MGNWKRAGSGGKKNCTVCGKPFLAYRSSAKYCSKKCQSFFGYQAERRLVHVICQHCGCSYQKPWNDLRHELKNQPDKAQVCSGRCLSLLRGTKVEFPCVHCGRMIFRYKDEVDKHQFNFCSKQCETESPLHRITGENHPWYKDGSAISAYGPGWSLARRRARKRDNFICRLCGVAEETLGKKLDVHHIIPFRDFEDSQEAHKIGNLISLCPSCHHRTEHIREPQITDDLKQMVI